MMTNRLVTLLLLTLCVCSCERKAAPTQRPPVGVTLIKIEPQTIPAVFEFVGFVESSHPVEIRARVEGYLDTIGYTEGSMVNEGDLLFQLDPKPFIATLESAKGLLAQNKAQQWRTEQDVKRLKPLYEQKAASQRDLDNAIAAQLSAEAAVYSSQAQVDTAQINLGYTTIRSPIKGLTGKSIYREGSLISPGPHGLLTTVSVIDPIWINFNVSENMLLKEHEAITKSQLIMPAEQEYRVQAVLGDGTLFPYLGTVNFAAPTLEQSTGTMLVRAVLPNPQGELKPGQFTRVNVIGAKRPNAIVVPQTAVIQGPKGMIVYLVREGKAYPQNIAVGDWYQNQWVVTEGLKAGDEVVVEGANKLVAGAPVVVLPQKTP